MNSRLIKVAALALSVNEFAVAADASDDDYKDLIEIKHDSMDSAMRNFDFVRGFWLGFNRGLYKDSGSTQEIEKECLNSNMRQKWQEAYSVWLGTDDLDDDIDGFTALGDVVQLIANLN